MQKQLRSFSAGKILTRSAIRVQLMLFILLTGLNAFAQLQLVKDINTIPVNEGPLPDDEYFTRLTPVNGSLFFVLYQSELWKTESTSLNASFIKEFVEITNLVNVHGTLFFTGDRGETGLELWKSDGTPAGTVLVKDIRPGTEGSAPSELTNVDGTVYFSAHDGSTGRELWKSDGTAEGTVRVKDIMRVVGSSNPANLINKDGFLLFTVNDGQRGYELWKSDGTAEGTVLVKDIRPEYKVSSSPQQLTNVNGTIFFTALVATGVRNLFKTDGTESGTVEVSNVSSDYRLLTNVDGTLFFAGRDPAHGLELWKSDGTAGGTVLVKDLTPGPGSSTGYAAPHLSHFKNINDKLFFLAVTPGPGIYSATQSLWVSDGTASGTEKLTEFEDISFSFINPYLTSFAGQAYFTATTNDGLSLLRTDGTPEGEGIFIENIASGHTSEAKLTVVDNYLYYVSNGSLWKTDGATTNVVSSGYATRDSNPQYITEANGVVYFTAAGNTSHGLYKSDGTDAGTLLIRNFPEPVTNLTISGGNLYYMANYFDYDGGIDGWKLWKTDLSTGFSTWVSDINRGDDDYITELTDVNGTLYFAVQSMAGEGQLWKTSGTLASTQHVKTFNTLANPPIMLTNVNGTLFFAASTDEWGNDLWKSDGTEPGTVLVNEINSTPEEPSDPFALTSANNMLFFIAYNGYDYELYKSDGTEAGTVMVKDLRSGDHNEFDINELTYSNGMVYFVAIGEQDGAGNYERDVWKTDGTETGTVKVATLPARYDTPFISGLHILDVVNGNLVLGLQDAGGNNALWKTDETEAGTVKIADLPGLANTNYFDDIAAKNNVIYFIGQTPYGTVLWRTDGTTCGSFELTAEGGPADLTLSNDQIFLAYEETFEYGSEHFGRELYTIDESEITVPCEDMSIATSTDSKHIIENQEGNSNEKAVAHYPNPFNADFVLNVNGEEGGFFDAKVSDLNGKAIGKYSQLQYNHDYMLGAGWMPGVYVLHVKKDNTLITKKIIKTR